MLRLIGIALLMAVVSAQGLVGDWEQDEVVQVAAAADLKFALDELLLEYKKAYPKAQRVNLSYGSSGNFFSQIKNGAPFTLYMSADSKYPLELEKANLIVQKTRKSYAVGRLVLWVPKTSALDITKLGPRALTDPRVRKIAIANPQHAPYGEAALTLLETFGLSDALRNKFVYGENIALTAQYAQTAADAGILALSIVKAPSFAALGGRYWLAPLESHKRLDQQMVILKEGKNTRRFWTFIASAEARALLAKYGFELPKER